MEKDDEKKSVFFENVIPFVDIEINGLIETEPFLQASKCIVQFVELFGITFMPVKKDIEGNINKLFKIFESNKSTYKHLNYIVKIEKETIAKDDLHVGTDALIWLNRALVYNQIFLSLFLDDYKKAESEEIIKNLPEDLTKHFDSAYRLTLKKHHSWFFRKIFSYCLMAAPTRCCLLQYLGYYNLKLPLTELRQVIVSSIEKYLQQLKLNTEAVSLLLLNHGYQP